MKIDLLCEIISNAGYGFQSYSGRGMSGARCLALVADNPLVAIANIVNEAGSLYDDPAQAQKTMQDALWVIRRAKTDDFGKSTIVYFPEIAWKE